MREYLRAFIAIELYGCVVPRGGRQVETAILVVGIAHECIHASALPLLVGEVLLGGLRQQAVLALRVALIVHEAVFKVDFLDYVLYPR